MSDFGDKARTIAIIGRRSRPQIQEGRDVAGNPFRSITDEQGNTVTEWDDHQDVTIRAPHVMARAITKDEPCQ